MSSESTLMDSLKIESTISQININNYSINYLTAGTGKPLLLVHGGNVGWGQWYPNIPALSKYFKIYAIDLPGGGRSTKIDFSKLDLNKDLLDVVEEFINEMGLKKFSFIGSSIAGWIGMQLAIKDSSRIDKLVLVDSVGVTDYMGVPDRIISITPIAKLLTRTILKPIRTNKNIEIFFRDVFFDKNVTLSPEFIEYFYETMATSHNLLFISRLASVGGVRKELNLTNKLDLIKCKTLIIWGQEDKLMPIDKVKPYISRIPDVKFIELKNAGHFPSIEKYQEFNLNVLDFLNN